MNGQLSKLYKPPILPPINFDPLEVPEVVELIGEDGERQFWLAQALAEPERSVWAPTVAGGLE